jgi:hypothetical protein
LLGSVLYPHLDYISIKYFFPFLLELLLIHEAAGLFDAFDAGLNGEHRGISSTILEVDLSHLPLEGLLVELGKVVGKQFNEQLTDIFELLLKVVAVELEGTVHYSAVIEGRHLYGLIWFWLGLRDIEWDAVLGYRRAHFDCFITNN